MTTAHAIIPDGEPAADDFLRAQLVTARLSAAAAARDLKAVCLDGASPEVLDRAAQRMLLAAAELRMAAQAVRLHSQG